MLAYSIPWSYKLIILDIVTNTLVKKLKLDFNTIKCKFSNDYKFIFLSDEDGYIH